VLREERTLPQAGPHHLLGRVGKHLVLSRVRRGGIPVEAILECRKRLVEFWVDSSRSRDGMMMTMMVWIPEVESKPS
jgi:hypothetical protein